MHAVQPSIAPALALAAAFAAAGASGCCSNVVASAPADPQCQLVESGPGPPGTTAIRAETVVDGLEVPWGIAFLPNGDLLATERAGRLRLVRGGKLLPPIATIPVSQESESGLLGIALSPDFATTRRFFLYLTAPEEGGRFHRVERWTLAEDGLGASRDEVVVDRIPAAAYHDGGRLRIGPDGMLYVGTGDGRQPFSAQLPASLGGKLLRITPDGAVPPDNPIEGSPVYLLGIRNTQGFDWLDAKTMVVTDHGPSGEMGRRGHDEVTVASAGANLGWPVVYGCESGKGYVTPSMTWREAVPPGGAAVYTGTAIAEWKGSMLIGSLGAKHLHRVVLDPKNPRRVAKHEVYLQGDPPTGLGRVRDVIMGPDGHLYVTTSNCDGRGTCPPSKDAVVRIVPASP